MHSWQVICFEASSVSPLRSGMRMFCVGADDVDEVSGYDETSIRYRGRNIPSKSFRMLQSMTGSGSDVPGKQSHKNVVTGVTIM